MPLTSEQAKFIRSQGRGRPKGIKLASTLLKEAVKKSFDQKVLRFTDNLFNAQAHLALVHTFMYKIEKEFVKNKSKEGGNYKNLPPKLVTSQSEIEDYLNETMHKANGDMYDENDPSATYYFLTAKEPNNMAIDSLLNRVHGKPKESVELDVNVKFSLKDLAQRRLQIQKAKEVIEEPKLAEDISA